MAPERCRPERSSRRRWGWLSIAIGVSASFIAAPSSACINGVVQERVSRESVASQIRSEDDLVDHLFRGEEHVRRGNLGAAAAELDMVERRLSFAGPRMRARFVRTHALLAVRTEGRWPQAVMMHANGPRYRARALATALTALQQRARELPDEPQRLSELGEALAAIPRHHAEALALLDRLARSDLLTSAHAYAALARLRHAARDEAGARTALEVCRKLDTRGVACAVERSGA